jgi:hypothetical protein
VTVLSQAPSSKVSEKAPLKSGKAIENSRVSKLERMEPSSTATTAKIGWLKALPV